MQYAKQGCEIHQFLHKNIKGQVNLVMDDSLISKGDDCWPFTLRLGKTYSEEEIFAKKISAAVFHRDWEEKKFGFFPCAMKKTDEGIMLRIHKNPVADGSDLVLFYSDEDMKPYYCGPLEPLACFNFGETGIYGLVVSLNRLTAMHCPFYGHDIAKLRNMIATEQSVA